MCKGIAGGQPDKLRKGYVVSFINPEQTICQGMAPASPFGIFSGFPGVAITVILPAPIMIDHRDRLGGGLP